MASLFVPGEAVTAAQFNARIRDEIAARRVPDSWGEFSTATTQSVVSSTNLAPYETSTSLDASDEQWANGFDDTFTARATIPSDGLYLVTVFGNFAAGTAGDWTTSVVLASGSGAIDYFGAAAIHSGGSSRASFSASTIAMLPVGTIYAKVGQASGGSINLDEFGFWAVRLSAQVVY